MCDSTQQVQEIQITAGLDLQDGDVVSTLLFPHGGGADILVRALRPTLHPEVADVVEAHNLECLRRHHVEVSTNAPLREMDSTWLLVAEAPGNATCFMGGVRFDLRDAAHALPLERVLAPFGERPLTLLSSRFVGRVGQLSGLWVRDEFRKLGLSSALVSAGIMAARRAGITRLFTFCSLHMRTICDAEGFHVRRELGDEGGFVWPNERNFCVVMEIDLAPTPTIGVTSGAKQCASRTELPGVADGSGITHAASRQFEETRR